MTATPSSFSSSSPAFSPFSSNQLKLPYQTDSSCVYHQSHSSQSLVSNSNDYNDILRILIKADHDMLVRAGNCPYNQHLQQLAQAESQHMALFAQIVLYKNAYNKIITAIPQLLSTTSNPFSHPIPSMPVSPSVNTPIAITWSMQWCPSRILLGQDMIMPLAPNMDSDCSKLPYFSRKGWNSQEKGKAGKGGPQSENVGLQFAEDINRQAVPYVVAKEMQAMLNSLFHSLLANGQAAEVSNSFTHEARMYIHVTMSNHFPLLLLCEGGR
ncbi:hypothetical protein HETIRDRAFT_167976 [Heterobasidion irregulare TC 32-1]|uniref:Uncharacterized protein n=1 Tax=Heterobasidion irregulare (strain TC 32-1) TaxID=747525 RepID=W4KLA0_HETIT|nr:uncharacterized protein HETIRDRAFT_167976 [Heterobasidion irregulare TC 32-1]ETW85811.1 hypothetical protein HETIRDRAFT_167976 [Heterobasidion irregulare TC 32-1]